VISVPLTMQPPIGFEGGDDKPINVVIVVQPQLERKIRDA
jgi:hypothetical protein